MASLLTSLESAVTSAVQPLELSVSKTVSGVESAVNSSVSVVNSDLSSLEKSAIAGVTGASSAVTNEIQSLTSLAGSTVKAGVSTFSSSVNALDMELGAVSNAVIAPVSSTINESAIELGALKNATINDVNAFVALPYSLANSANSIIQNTGTQINAFVTGGEQALANDLNNANLEFAGLFGAGLTNFQNLENAAFGGLQGLGGDLGALAGYGSQAVGAGLQDLSALGAYGVNAVGAGLGALENAGGALASGLGTGAADIGQVAQSTTTLATYLPWILLGLAVIVVLAYVYYSGKPSVVTARGRATGATAEGVGKGAGYAVHYAATG